MQTYLSIRISQINKSMSTRASFAGKSYITLFKMSYENCFLYIVPKLWNTLPNNITSQCNVNSFNTYLFKYVLTVNYYCLVSVSWRARPIYIINYIIFFFNLLCVHVVLWVCEFV